MTGLNKIFTFFFAILLILVVGEVGYLLFSNTAKTVANKTVSQKNTSPNEPVLDSNGPPLLPTNTPMPVEQRALNKYILEGISILPKGILTSSIMTNRYEGEVVSIEKKEGYTPRSHIKFDFEITLEGKNGLVDTFYYTKTNMEHFKFAESTDGVEKPIKFEDFKIGDSIIIETKLDLTKETEEVIVDGSKIIKVSPNNN